MRSDDADISEAKIIEDGKTGKRRPGVLLHLRLSGMVSARECTSTSSTHVLQQLAAHPVAASHLISRVNKKRIKNTLETTLVFNQLMAEQDLPT